MFIHPTITHSLSTTLAVWIMEGNVLMDLVSILQHQILRRHLVYRSASHILVLKCLVLKMTSSWTSRMSSYVQSGAHSSLGAR